MKEDQERTPLRTILTNFLNHIENLESQRSPEDSYESEFQELKLFSETIKGCKQYSCSEGEKEVNRKKNRYKDILPFDISRVILNEYAGIPGSDYINANYIKGASGSPAYIASQGPLPHTVNDFWRMVVQCEVQVIVMACNEEEAGKHKCENYWVDGEGEEKQFGMVTIRLIKASTVCPDFSVRTMRLKYTTAQSNVEERTVCQFHYSAWPDHGVPPLVKPLLDMVRLVRDTQASETLPVLVHCSAGCGRTGTICAIDYVWGLLRAGKLTKDFSLLSLVREMRKQRIAMVQTKEQYVLVHQAVRELFREQLRMIDSHPYENIDCNGHPLIKYPSPEPTYESVMNYQPNNITEEKQDEKEKEMVAPPIPQKKRFHTLSTKQEKEVENLSERQRLVEQAESSSESIASSSTSGTSAGHRPRIAKLKSLFERNSNARDNRQVARSHSLGAVRNSRPVPPPSQLGVTLDNNQKEHTVVKDVALPIPCRGILRVPQLNDQRPALPVKRSKSLRVLGTGDRYKLSIPASSVLSCDIDSNPKTAAEKARRLSLESNVDEMRDSDRKLGTDEGTRQLIDKQDNHVVGMDSVVAGLGVRERRNSFRQAVNRGTNTSAVFGHKDYESVWGTSYKKPALLRSYTSVDIRTSYSQSMRHAVGLEEFKVDDKFKATPNKPIIKPKPPVFAIKTQGKVSDTLGNKVVQHGMKSNEFQNPLAIQVKPFNSNNPVNTRSHTRGERHLDIKRNEGKVNLLTSQHSREDMFKQNEQVHANRLEYTNLDRSTGMRQQNQVPNLSIPAKQRVLQNVPSSYPKPISSSSSKVVTSSKKTQSDDTGVNKYSSVEPRKTDICTGIREGPMVKTYGGSRANPQFQTPKLNMPYQPQQEIANRRKQEFSQNSRQGILEQRADSSSSNSNNKLCTHTGHEVRSVQNDRSVQPRSNPINPFIEMRSNPLSPAQSSSNRTVVYDSRINRQEQMRNYGLRPKAPPPPPAYSEHNRSNYKLNTSVQAVFNSRMAPTNVSQEQEQRYRQSNLRDHRDGSKVFSESRMDHECRQTAEVKPLHHDVRQSAVPVDRANSQVYYESHHPTKYCHSKLYAKSYELKSSPDTRQHTQPHTEDHRSSQYSKPNTSLEEPAQKVERTPQLKSGFAEEPHSSSALQSSGRPNMSNSDAELAPYGVKLRRGSRDDLALCSNMSTPSRVKRHASVVLLRHSLIENGTPTSSDSSHQPTLPLTVWTHNSQANGEPTSTPSSQSSQLAKKKAEDPWSGAVGVDLDQVAASISQKDGNSTKLMRAALEALHLRKGTTPQAFDASAEPKSSVVSPPVSQQPFRRQQQYL